MKGKSRIGVCVCTCGYINIHYNSILQDMHTMMSYPVQATVTHNAPLIQPIMYY